MRSHIIGAGPSRVRTAVRRAGEILGSDAVRLALFHFIENILAAPAFDLNDVNVYLRETPPRGIASRMPKGAAYG